MVGQILPLRPGNGGNTPWAINAAFFLVPEKGEMGGKECVAVPVNLIAIGYFVAQGNWAPCQVTGPVTMILWTTAR